MAAKPVSSRKFTGRHGWAAFLAARTRQGWTRVREGWYPILEAAVACGLAWMLASWVLHRPTPFFAPIAAFVALGYSPDRSPRRVAELGAGATLGVLIGEAVSRVMGLGPLEIIATVFLATCIGRLLDSGPIFAMQATTNAIVTLAFVGAHYGPPNASTDRWIDALSGAFMAFVIAVLMPRRPVARPTRLARSSLREFAVLLDLVAAGLRSGRPAALRAAQGQRRALETELNQLDEAVKTAQHLTRLNPAMRRARPHAAELARLAKLVRRAVRSTDAITRQGSGMAEEVGRGVEDIAAYLTVSADAVRAIEKALVTWSTPESAQKGLSALAHEIAPSEVDAEDWRPVALTALCRALVVDLLQMSGLSKSKARAALPDTHGRPYAERDTEGVIPVDAPEDDHSRLWG